MQHLHSAAPTRVAHNTTSNHTQRRDSQYRTTDRVLQILLQGDLYRLRVESVASQLGMSATTLRRRLRMDHTHYQFLLDRARQYRCEQALRASRLPGKCLADELGYLEVNSFYRAFRRWTGVGFSAWKAQRL
jgi:AraC-like DNA-binding protein